MPLGYSVDPERRLVIITGEFTSPTEWATLASQLLRDPRVKGNFGFIRDLLGATHTHSPATVLAIFRIVQRFWPTFAPAKGAIIADSTNIYAAQVAQALADEENLPIRVFGSYDEALEWMSGKT